MIAPKPYDSDRIMIYCSDGIIIFCVSQLTKLRRWARCQKRGMQLYGINQPKLSDVNHGSCEVCEVGLILSRAYFSAIFMCTVHILPHSS
jgi:hypothetical protein